MPEPYGMPIGSEDAKKAAAAALAEARKNGWKMAAAVVEIRSPILQIPLIRT